MEIFFTIRGFKARFLNEIHRKGSNTVTPKLPNTLFRRPSNATRFVELVSGIHALNPPYPRLRRRLDRYWLPTSNGANSPRSNKRQKTAARQTRSTGRSTSECSPRNRMDGLSRKSVNPTPTSAGEKRNASRFGNVLTTRISVTRVSPTCKSVRVSIPRNVSRDSIAAPVAPRYINGAPRTGSRSKTPVSEIHNEISDSFPQIGAKSETIVWPNYRCWRKPTSARMR